MMIAKSYMEKSWLKSTNATLVEFGVVVAFSIQYVVSLAIGGTPGYYSIVFAISLYAFASGKGMISKFLSHPIFHKLSGYSFYFYMIHELALRIFRKVFPESEVFLVKGYVSRCIMIAVPALLVSVLFAVCYHKLTCSRKD